MHRTKCVILVNGQPVAGVFWEKLLRITITDKEGTKSDSLDMMLEDGPPHLAIPQENDEVQCWLGYEDGPFDYMGRYKVNDVEVECFPWRLHVRAKAADHAETLKQPRRRHWDDKTFGDVAQQMASEHGLTAQVDSEIARFKPDGDWFGQENESDLNWLERWAERLGGAMSIKDGKLLIPRAGSGMTPGGQSLPRLVVTPPMHIKGTMKVFFGKREEHKDTQGEYHDAETGERKHERAAGYDRGSSRYSIRHGASGRQEAKAAARAQARYLKAGGTRTSCGLVGNPFVKAGGPMTYRGFRPGVDGIEFVIEEAIHTYSKGGAYKADVRGKKRVEGSGGGGKQIGADGVTDVDDDADAGSEAGGPLTGVM